MEAPKVHKLGDCSDANFPMTAEGETYHLGVKKGQVANRIVTSGDVGRIDAIAKTPGFEIEFERQAPRLFKIITGHYKGVRISLVASLMGIPNMDFTVRELRAVVDGPMAIIRIGTCGTPQPTVPVGDIVCGSKGGFMVIRNPDGFDETIPEKERPEKYLISRAIMPDEQLEKLLVSKLTETFGSDHVHEGKNASCDSFYSSQGRISPQFNDHNEHLVDKIVEVHPDTVAIEMESAHMMDLARCTNPGYEIHTGCAAIVLAQRRSNAFLSLEQKHACETGCAVAALEAVSGFVFPESHEH